LTEAVNNQISTAPGVAFKGVVSAHALDVPDANTTRGDSLAMMIRRDGSGGNPDDTYSGAAVVRNLRLRGSVWRLGESNG
jgi:hypothetical protein